MASRLPPGTDALFGRACGAGSRIPVGWVHALLQNADEWLPTDGSSRGRHQARATAAMAVFMALLDACADGDCTPALRAARRALAFDLAQRATPITRQGKAAMRYATAQADKAEWVRGRLKKVEDRALACLIALNECGALSGAEAATAAASIERHLPRAAAVHGPLDKGMADFVGRLDKVLTLDSPCAGRCCALRLDGLLEPSDFSLPGRGDARLRCALLELEMWAPDAEHVASRLLASLARRQLPADDGASP